MSEKLNRKALEQGLTEEQTAVWNQRTCQERNRVTLVYVHRCF